MSKAMTTAPSDLAERVVARDTNEQLIGRLIALAVGFERHFIQTGDVFDEAQCGVICRTAAARLLRPSADAEAEAREIAIRLYEAFGSETWTQGALIGMLAAALARREALGAEKERERCARIAEGIWRDEQGEATAAAIRAGGDNG